MTQTYNQTTNLSQHRPVKSDILQPSSLNNLANRSVKAMEIESPAIISRAPLLSSKAARSNHSMHPSIANFLGTPTNLPNIIKNQEMAMRQRTFNIFFKNNARLDGTDTKMKSDHQAIGRNSSVQQIQHLVNVAKQRDQCSKKNSGVMFVNELWDDRSYKKIIESSGIQSYKDNLEKLSHAPFPDRKELFLQFFEKNHKQVQPTKTNTNDSPCSQDSSCRNKALPISESKPEKSLERGLSSYRSHRMQTDPNDVSPSANMNLNNLNFMEIATRCMNDLESNRQAKSITPFKQVRS